MSKGKKEIHVKDLVIIADDVRIEPSRSKNRDPFFFGSRPRQDDVESEDRHVRRDPFFGRPFPVEGEQRHHERNEMESSVKRDDDHVESDESRDKGNRRPFSWI